MLVSFVKKDMKLFEQIVKDFEVDYIVEGSVWCDVDQVCVMVQLIQMSDQMYLWVVLYDCDLDDIFDMQNEVVVLIFDLLVIEFFFGWIECVG